MHGESDDMEIRIRHSFLNGNIIIIVDCCYNRNPTWCVCIRMCFYVYMCGCVRKAIVIFYFFIFLVWVFLYLHLFTQPLRQKINSKWSKAGLNSEIPFS